MPRLPRLHVPGGYYHVYARGNGKQDIFLDSYDRLHWEKLLSEGLQRHNHYVHAYCWMTNHIHIAIQAGEKPLSRFIGTLLSRYAKGFNRKRRRSGHVFERRHGEILVKDDSYLLELVRYIHQNPKRAGIVSRVNDYKWSSHHAYVGNMQIPWLKTESILSLFGSNIDSARRHYLDFVGEEQPKLIADQVRNGSTIDYRLLGDDMWLYDVLRRTDITRDFDSVDQVIDKICRQNNVTETILASPSRSRTNARIRAEIALVATDLGLASMTEIARRFGRSIPVVSKGVRRLRDGYSKR